MEIKLKSDKPEILHFSGASTICESPEDLKPSPKKTNNEIFDTRRYSLPLNKIIISVPAKKQLLAPIEPAISKKLSQNLMNNDKMLEILKEIKITKPKVSFLNQSMEIEKRGVEGIKMKPIEREEKTGQNKKVVKTHKPSRFLRIDEWNLVRNKPKVCKISNHFEEDIKLIMQNKYEKVKADFQIEKILQYRAQTRHKTMIKHNDSEWKWRTPDCTPKEKKVVHF